MEPLGTKEPCIYTNRHDWEKKLSNVRNNLDGY